LKSTVPVPARSDAPDLVASAPNHAVARFGFLVFLASESMLFAGLLAALAVLRWNADRWPPPGLPRLPVLVTAGNTLVLFASTIPMARALRAVREGELASFARSVSTATLLGIGFLVTQGSEWARLVAAGLRASSGPYGATFFTLVGCHALHVSVGVIWLVILRRGARRGRFTAASHFPVELGAIYWYYVSAVWAVIFPALYLGLR
jgi:heme/copper-type cytochrome/quinol oxidase subunit 3